MRYGGTEVSLGDFNIDTPVTSSGSGGIGEGGFNTFSTVATAAADLWSNISTGIINARMQRDAINFNNRMRAIQVGMQQHAAGVNKNTVTDAHMQDDVNINLDRMRAEAQVATEGAYLGASSSAQKSAMFDVNRNALQAKFNSQNNFELMLDQIRMQEQGMNFDAIQAHQNTGSIKNNTGLMIAGAATGLVKKSLDSGAWDTGSKLNSYFTSLFSKGSAVQLPSI